MVSEAWQHDRVEKVTGMALYTSDMSLPGMAHGALVRSNVPHGVIRSIDVSEALAQPGVICVVTGEDLAGLDPYVGDDVLDWPFLALARVRYAGEPVAGVVAESVASAERAAALVAVDIDPLPAVLDAEEALLLSAVVLHPDRPSASRGLANVCYEARYEVGDVDAAIARAAFVHRQTYRFQPVSQCTMEPHSSIASWNADELAVWTGTQEPFPVRAGLARVFGISFEKVRVRVPYIGGAYGAKTGLRYEPVAALMARKAGRPVKVVVGSEGTFLTTSRHGAVVHMTTAVDEAGNIIARDVRTVYDTGAYADKGPRVARKGGYRAAGPYRIPNVRSVALAVYTNKVPASAYRGFATPQVVWAGESAIDEIAAALGEDPLEFRLRRLAARGDTFLDRDLPIDADLRQGLRLAAEAIDWSDDRAAGVGRGVAVGVKDGGGGPGLSGAEVRLTTAGRFEVLVATAELGQGAHGIFCDIAARELHVPVELFDVIGPDTALVPHDPYTGASRSTVTVGSAVQQGARALGGKLRDVMVELWGTDDFRIEGGDLVVGGDRITIADFATRAEGSGFGGVLSCLGLYEVPTADTPLGSATPFYEVSHGGAEVEVDRDTGQLRLRRYVSVADVGRAINPEKAAGQDAGAVVMGIGHTLQEELLFDGGVLINPNLVEYSLPTMDRLPVQQLHTILLENDDGPGPDRSKGMGEGGIVPVAPAIANALYAASGVRIRELPLTPERVWRALRDR